jgi:hypothetical protein
MNEQQRKERNTCRLAQLYQPFAKQVQGVIADLEAVGYRPRIQEAYRSPADQIKAFNSGHSKLRYGFHNVTAADGTPEGLAVDLYDDDRPLAPSTAYLLRLSASAWARGLATGVLWGLDKAQRKLLTDAINEGAWDRDLRTGWDSWHIEPTGLTPQQARAGTRPQFHAQPPAPVAAPVEPYTVSFFDNATAVVTRMIKDRPWLSLRLWGEYTEQPVTWQGDGLPILMGSQPYSGEMALIDADTYSPVRDLAAFSGFDLDLNVAERKIAVKRPN